MPLIGMNARESLIPLGESIADYRNGFRIVDLGQILCDVEFGELGFEAHFFEDFLGRLGALGGFDSSIFPRLLTGRKASIQCKSRFR